MANNNSASPPQTDADGRILAWYARLYSRRVDLVGDFAGSERFLIHGESLLLECFSDSHLDFSNGFQILHATYAVEKFLHGLLTRQCHFHVAFFDDHQDLCIPQGTPPADSERYLLARAAIIRHLKVNLQEVQPDIKILTFQSSTSDEFATYLQETDIYFVLCHDGASSNDSQRRQAAQKDLKAPENEEKVVPDSGHAYKTGFRTLIYGLMQRGYNTALLNGLQLRDTKIETTVLEPSRSMNIDISASQPVSKYETSTTNPEHLRKAIDAIKSNAESPLSEREYLSILLTTKLASSSSPELIAAFLYHVALLSEQSLMDRQGGTQEGTQEASNYVRELMSKVAREGRSILAAAAWHEALESTTCDVGDLLDGRLFALCAHSPFSLPPSSRYELLQETLEALTDLELPDLSETATGKSSSSNKDGTNGATPATSYKLLPFSNDVFDEHLKPINLDVGRSGGKADATSSSIFREVSHWQNNKRPIDQKVKGQLEKDPKIAKKALRRNQFFMAEMTSYAASLTNVVGKSLEPETIIVGEKAIEKPTARPKQQQQKQSSKNINKSKQAMMENIAASSKQKDEDNAAQLHKNWAFKCDQLSKQADLASRYNGARQFLMSQNSDFKRRTLEPEVRLFMLNVLVEMWIRYSREEHQDEGIYIAALVFDTVRAFTSLPNVTKTIANCLRITIEKLSLPELQLPAAQGDRKLNFQFALLDDTVPLPDLSIGLSPKQFQLLHCGPYFDRTMDSAPDPRVPFEPDAWQRKVLDEIDAHRSLLVIAPTSAGKTFISFYAMKQVLEANNNDVLVYVAPTKALVNQIAAEVQARFSKNYKYSQSVWGISTRDYRINNATGCQILVTVPHILQIMLLAPSHANSWSKRVKWIIFDEVHCIGQAEDGLIWEQLLLMAPCPIIALSATIGNATAFNSWLTSAQKAAGHEFAMVQHHQRYSDLRKFVYTQPEKVETSTYLPLPSQRTFAQLGLDERGNFVFLHPVTSITNRERGMPSDFTLEARDCLSLWQSMQTHQSEKYPVDKALDPSHLPAVIKKADIVKWQAGLQQTLASWIADELSPFELVKKELSKPLAMLTSQPIDEGEDADGEDNDFEARHDLKSVLPLLADLQRQDALPGLVFNFDRTICEQMCRTIMKQLTDAEATYKQTSSKWKDKLREWDEWKKEMARRVKQGVRGANKGMTKEDQMREAASQETSSFDTFDPDKPIEGFSFADNKKMSQTEIDGLTYDMRRRGVDEWLLDALRRGIGVHHAGMNRKYRIGIEVLFRKGYLRVMIATGTLALGVNSPSKTVVFSGDSVFLTALNFRQAAGRAGRRGFDLLGNVVFHGISESKIHTLISSKLPDLIGHFPITTTLVLRLCTLLQSSGQSQFAVRSINGLLSQPRLYLGGEEAKTTVLHHLRFSIEYLRRQHLLDSAGAPLNFAGAVGHLYFTENSAFAFHALLKDGYFHNLCAKIGTNQEAVLRELMLTMSHLFGRQYLRQADCENIEEVAKKSPSMVLLPSMPADALEVLRKHNASVLEIYTAYIRTFVDQNVKEADTKLPLTAMSVGAAKASKSSETRARSAFVALSGYDDTFETIHDLCSTVRSGVFLEEAVIPYVELSDDSGLPLNAYLYDYFNHSNPSALITANKILRGDLWFVLNDFSMILATVVTSLSSLMNLGTESDLDFIEVRGGGDEAEEDKEDKFLPNDAASEITNFSGTTLNSGTGPVKEEMPIQVKKKKTKVVDSWEEASEEEEDIDEDWDAEDSDQEAPTWEEGAGLLNVLKAFKALKEDFDIKFRAMWA